MLQKIEKAALQLRFIMLALFIIISVIMIIFYACQEEERKYQPGILALWPPDMVPHPPHFPGEKPKKPGEATPALG